MPRATANAATHEMPRLSPVMLPPTAPPRPSYQIRSAAARVLGAGDAAWRRLGRRAREIEVLPLPGHRIVNAVATARVVIEEPLLQRTRAHLAVLAQVNGGLSEPVGLATGIEAEQVSLA